VTSQHKIRQKIWHQQFFDRTSLIIAGIKYEYDFDNNMKASLFFGVETNVPSGSLETLTTDDDETQ
jgi:hypothetical protein